MNSVELKAAMLRNNDNGKTLAEYLGITNPTLSHKMTGKTDFTAREIGIIRQKYSLTDEQTCRIFLIRNGLD